MGGRSRGAGADMMDEVSVENGDQISAWPGPNDISLGESQCAGADTTGAGFSFLIVVNVGIDRGGKGMKRTGRCN